MMTSSGKVLVTGVTGNVGMYVAKHLIRHGIAVKGATSRPEAARSVVDEVVELVRFDFEDTATFDAALDGVEKVFLIRPPAMSDPNAMKPFLNRCVSKCISHIVFLSLLGIERNPFPPHYKIEKMIKASGIAYTFMRPSFFMQNLSTTHQTDIREHDDLFIPAGKAKVSFIDTRDIGEASALVLMDSENHQNRGYTLTGSEAITYQQAADILSDVLDRRITYSNPSSGTFKKTIIARGIPKEFATVMTVLYLTTKLGMANKVTSDLERLLGRKPRTFRQFAQDHMSFWQRS
ncbi:SDR family oxidoreductase [Paenibacillus sp. LC231]|uniref:SDR family oxidoreductase n=1 Tax=Paenibacillus sp. LC231 TaxID=1120679 RepID=UPI000B3215ED|nr:SDR family oxidoreductase [Paenibacillus sp. LC231]